jgi:hypothetical protein
MHQQMKAGNHLTRTSFPDEMACSRGCKPKREKARKTKHNFHPRRKFINNLFDWNHKSK